MINVPHWVLEYSDILFYRADLQFDLAVFGRKLLYIFAVVSLIVFVNWSYFTQIQ